MASYSTCSSSARSSRAFSSDAVSGSIVSSSTCSDRISVVAFICNHCPYVLHIQAELARFGTECEALGVKLVAITRMQRRLSRRCAGSHGQEARRRLRVPVPFDEDQARARVPRRCTPEFYVFDAQGSLAYRGRFDAAPESTRPEWDELRRRCRR